MAVYQRCDSAARMKMSARTCDDRQFLLEAFKALAGPDESRSKALSAAAEMSETVTKIVGLISRPSRLFPPCSISSPSRNMPPHVSLATEPDEVIQGIKDAACSSRHPDKTVEFARRRKIVAIVHQPSRRSAHARLQGDQGHADAHVPLALEPDRGCPGCQSAAAFFVEALDQTVEFAEWQARSSPSSASD